MAVGCTRRHPLDGTSNAVMRCTTAVDSKVFALRSRPTQAPAHILGPVAHVHWRVRLQVEFQPADITMLARVRLRLRVALPLLQQAPQLPNGSAETGNV